jgi:hypothetical protein
MKQVRHALFGALLLGLSGFFSGCQGEGPQENSNTNWLRECDSTDDCGSLVCLCGTCTQSCDTEDDCAEDGRSSCIAATEAGASIVCDGAPPTAGICLPRCEDQACPDGTSCIAGVCRGTPESAIAVSVDSATRYQELFGFGASLAYNEAAIAAHPEKEALFDAMFAESGIDIIRMGNHQPDGGAAALADTQEIIDAARERLGSEPLLFMTAGSPPATLKENGVRYCSNLDPDCTLVRGDTGQFDYAAYAEYWRASLEAYASVGIEPDFVSIQNNANWIPAGDLGAEACKFLPTEGTELMEAADGTQVEVSFPGYVEATAAVEAAISTLPSEYSLTGPELLSAALMGPYADATADLASISVNFYDVDPEAVDVASLEELGTFAKNAGKPILQSEVHVEAPESMVLIHHALATLGASAYMQQGFAGPSSDVTHPVLIGLDSGSFAKHDTYFVLSHFARFTDAGFTRVAVDVDSEDVLATAWLSPEADDLTLIVINPTNRAEDVTVGNLDTAQGFRVLRTSLETSERFVDIGPLPSTGFVRLPPVSIVTITSRE